MKKSLMMVGAMLIGTVMLAQDFPKDSRTHDSGQREKMKNTLGLSETQYATLKGIEKKYAVKHAGLRKDSSRTRTEKYDALKTLRTDRQKEIIGMLTPEQRITWHEAKLERGNRYTTKNPKHEGNRWEKMQTTLSLSSAQLQTLTEAEKVFAQKRRAAKTREASEVKMLRQAHQATVKSTLTEEQFKQWTALKKEKRPERKGKAKK